MSNVTFLPPPSGPGHTVAALSVDPNQAINRPIHYSTYDDRRMGWSKELYWTLPGQVPPIKTGFKELYPPKQTNKRVGEPPRAPVSTIPLTYPQPKPGYSVY